VWQSAGNANECGMHSRKLPSGLCGNRTLVGETPKRSNTDHRADKHNTQKGKTKKLFKKKKKKEKNAQPTKRQVP